MKLIAEKIDDRYRCVVPGVGVLSFRALPDWQYQWSGYANMSGGEAEFVRYNFGNGHINDKACYLCSVENGVALLEYIDRYVLKYELFGELEECLCAVMDYWFLLAWECAEGHYDDLPDWCHAIIDLYIEQGRILRFNIASDQYEGDYFVFDRLDLEGSRRAIEDILRAALVQCREEMSEQEQGREEQE